MKLRVGFSPQEIQASNIRPWLFTPKAKFSNLAALNEWLHMRCEQLGERNHPIFKDNPIDEVIAEDLAHFLTFISEEH